MRLGLTSAACAALCLVLAACGDDDPTGGGGSGGAPEGGAGGDGGRPTTGGGGEGGDGGGGAPLKGTGESCAADAECEGGVCITEEISGWAQGYCTTLCDDILAPCGAGTSCVQLTQMSSACLYNCDGPRDCPGVANSCVDAGLDDLVCVGGCNDNAQCAVSCDNDSGFCTTTPEICDNGVDDDGDGLSDCSEVDCAIEDAECAAAIGAACAAAIPLTPGTPQDGTTSGQSTFVTNCVGEDGAPEALFTFTAPDDGFLSLTLASDGDLGLGVRTDCANPAAEIACVDAVIGVENLTIPVTNGATYTIIVEGYTPGEEGNFTLSSSFAIPVAESEPNDTSATADQAVAGIFIGSIDPTADEDWYALTLAATSTVGAQTISRNANICEQGTLDSYLTLYEADGSTIISENDDISFFGNFCSIVGATDLAPGTYYLQVKKSDLAPMGATFDYGLAIDVQ